MRIAKQALNCTSERSLEFVFHQRLATTDCPAGITVSRHTELPDGDFRITEFCWGRVSLWFVDADKFNAHERELICRAYACGYVENI